MSYSKRVTRDQTEKILDCPQLSRANLKVLNKFNNHCIAEGLKEKSILNYLRHLRGLALYIKRPFMQMTKEDLEKFLAARQKSDFLDKIDYEDLIYDPRILKLVRNRLKKRKEQNIGVSEKTINEIKVTIKKFYKWLYKKEDYPKVVKWIKTSRKVSSTKLPEELLTVDDIKAMVEKTPQVRDKVVIMTLYESACRVGEILNLKIKHLTFDKYGAILIVSGKTGMRRLRLIDSVPYLTKWLSMHPFADDPEASLFISIGNNRKTGKEIGYAAIFYVLKNAAKLANIKKCIHPHLMRHSRLTELAKIFTEQELKVWAGWEMSSYMPKIYVHLSGKDIDRKILEKRGLLKPEEEEKAELKKLAPKNCPRCEEVNPATAKFCYKCGMALSIKTAMDYDREKDEVLNLSIKQVLSDPEKAKELGKLIDNLQIMREKLVK